MTERLLQFIWQFQYFNKSELKTSAGDTLQIIFPGQHNTNQGPDFSDARIKIGNTTWAGSIELHFKTSDWKKHKHDKDENYSNVILHVVWEDDNFQQNALPVLEIKGRVSKILLERYKMLMDATGFIACANSIHNVRDIVWESWKERLLAERLIRKAKAVEIYLQQSNYNWEQTFWWLFARNFGMTVNADAFEKMARSIPLNILAKHKNQIHQLEALLMGQAGLLTKKFQEDYPKMLQKEYEFYKAKYNLRPCHVTVFFLRMRPGNFPTIRLAQLATLIQESAHLFSKIKEETSVNKIKKWLDVTANDYWHYHYQFDDASFFKKKRLGVTMIDSIIINTIVPILFAYGSYHHEEKYKQKALLWLEETSAEANLVTKNFKKLKIESKNAADSQSLIELKTQYCDGKMCLDCGVGNSLLKSQ